jgi:hypothetical protein
MWLKLVVSEIFTNEITDLGRRTSDDLTRACYTLHVFVVLAFIPHNDTTFQLALTRAASHDKRLLFPCTS